MKKWLFVCSIVFVSNVNAQFLNQRCPDGSLVIGSYRCALDSVVPQVVAPSPTGVVVRVPSPFPASPVVDPTQSIHQSIHDEVRNAAHNARIRAQEAARGAIRR